MAGEAVRVSLLTKRTLTRRRLTATVARAGLTVVVSGCGSGAARTAAPQATSALAAEPSAAARPDVTAVRSGPTAAAGEATRAATAAPAPTITTVATPAATPITTQLVRAQSARFAVPQALSLRFETEIVPESAGEGLPAFIVNPRYLRFHAQAPGEAEAPAGFELDILPVRRYTEISDVAGRELERLRTLLAAKPDLAAVFPSYPAGAERTSREQNLPILPMVNAAPEIQVRPAYLAFQDGAGVRWLTHLSQQLPTPIDTALLEYRFQGLSTDGVWCVAARFPVGVRLETTATPPPSNRWSDAPRDIALYNQQVVDQLSVWPDQRFSPPLDALDELLRSLTVGAAPLPDGA